MQSQQWIYLRHHVVIARDKRFAFSLHSHEIPLEVVRNEHGWVKNDTTLNVSVFLLEDILDGDDNVFLPVRTECFVRLQIYTLLQACF